MHIHISMYEYVYSGVCIMGGSEAFHWVPSTLTFRLSQNGFWFLLSFVDGRALGSGAARRGSGEKVAETRESRLPRTRNGNRKAIRKVVWRRHGSAGPRPPAPGPRTPDPGPRPPAPLLSCHSYSHNRCITWRPITLKYIINFNSSNDIIRPPHKLG